MLSETQRHLGDAEARKEEVQQELDSEKRLRQEEVGLNFKFILKTSPAFCKNLIGNRRIAGRCIWPRAVKTNNDYRTRNGNNFKTISL